MVGDRIPRAFLNTPFREADGVFSPDGRWVAYQSNESGRPEVYVRPVVPPGAVVTAAAAGGQWQVSTAGGAFPAWRPDGKELYYLNPAGRDDGGSITVTVTTLAPWRSGGAFPTLAFAGGCVDTQHGSHTTRPHGRV